MSTPVSSATSSKQQQQQPQGVRFNGPIAANGNNGTRHRRSNSKPNNNNNNNGNNNRRSNSAENNKLNKLSPAELEIVSKHMDDRTLYLLSSAIGSKCIVTVASGTRYMGLLYTTSSTIDGGQLSIVLKFPELYSLSSDDEIDPNDELPDSLIIDFKDFADLEILDLDLTTETSTSSSLKESTTTFKTDKDISSSRVALEERELEKWVPEDSDSILSGGLEDGSSNNTRNWDQFAVNERKFGIQSSFNEEMYTTKISKDDPKYKERLEIADRLAREIEGSSYNGNIHLAEERGIAVDDSGLDEEDKYSGVDRRGEELMAAIRSGNAAGAAIPSSKSNDFGKGDANANRYVPPRQRAAQYHDDPAVVASSATSVKKEDEKKKLPSTLPHKPSSGIKQQSFSSETSKINAQSEINALKEFSANFKIPTKFPKDLLPIVTKDKSKQEEILKKFEEEAAKKEELSKKEELIKKEKEQLLSQQQQQPSTTSGTNAPVKKKMDPKTAITFKMNPNSASFQPSGGFTPPNAIRPSFATKSPAAIHPSPRLVQASPAKKAATTPLSFFGSRVPKEDVKSGDDFKNKFNFFVTVESVGNLEKPFVTAPTWEQEMDESYITLFQLIPEKIVMTLPPPPNMRYYPPPASALQSPMGMPQMQLLPTVTPLSPSHHHHHHPSQSPIPLQAPIHPQQVPVMMPPSFNGDEANRNLSPSPQLIPPYYSGFMPNGPPNMAPPPQQQQQQQQQHSSSPRQRHHNSNRHNHHNNNNNNSSSSNSNNHYNQQLQQQQQQQQGQYPMVIPMPPQGGQYARGAPMNYPGMGYYIVGLPKWG